MTTPSTQPTPPRDKWDPLLDWIAYDLVDSRDPIAQAACARVRELYGLPPVQFRPIKTSGEEQAGWDSGKGDDRIEDKRRKRK
jgi:hypothetical protein